MKKTCMKKNQCLKSLALKTFRIKNFKVKKNSIYDFLFSMNIFLQCFSNISEKDPFCKIQKQKSQLPTFVVKKHKWMFTKLQWSPARVEPKWAFQQQQQLMVTWKRPMWTNVTRFNPRGWTFLALSLAYFDFLTFVCLCSGKGGTNIHFYSGF